MFLANVSGRVTKDPPLTAASAKFSIPDLASSLPGNRDGRVILLGDLSANCGYSAVRSSDLPQRTQRTQRIVAPSEIP
jgi:hypothetical protein